MRTDPSRLGRIEDAEKRKTEYLEQRDKQRAEPNSVAPGAGPVSAAGWALAEIIVLGEQRTSVWVNQHPSGLARGRVE